MKKKSVLLLAAMLMFNLVACGEAGTASSVPDEIVSSSATESSVEESTVEESSTEESSTEEPSQESTVEESTQESGTEEKNLTEEEAAFDAYREQLLEEMESAKYGSNEEVNKFITDMFEKGMEDENPLLSPVSAYFALSMAASGSAGETKAEFEEVLGTSHAMNSGLMMKSLVSKNKDTYQLSIANSVWSDDEMNITSTYGDFVRDIYGSEFFHENLASEETMEHINEWCSEQTSGMIPHFLKEPLSQDARLSLINAVYMKGQWVNTFDPEDTQEKEFYKEDGSIVNVDMMKSFSQYNRYINTEYCKGTVLDYKDTDMAFLAVMPKDGMDVRECYRNLAKEDLATLISNSDREEMDVFLPKFEIECETDLSAITKDMGIQDAFSASRADFSLIGQTDYETGVCISTIRQRAKIKVDEEGTEAAAVTQITMVDACEAIEDYLLLEYNQPFVYMIVEKKTGMPLFIGIMDDPTIQ